MYNYPICPLPEYFISDYFGMTIPLPKQLRARGEFPTDASFVFLTVVGSRNHSAYGAEVCKKLINGLRGYPIVIVSGLAVGIDTIAHESAMEAGLRVVAFPGSGLDEKIIYPRSNLQLAKKILDYGGCLLSELDDTTVGNSWTFPARNRLIAGLSRATLLIEATHKSGSAITARLATEYNRDVLAVPGPIFSQQAEAPNHLIQMGATPITCSEDILEALGFQITAQPMLDLFARATPDEQQILKLLASPISRGDVIRDSELSTAQVNILLSQLEMKGLIKDMGGILRRI